jgi:putative thioredoxin
LADRPVAAAVTLSGAVALNRAGLVGAAAAARAGLPVNLATDERVVRLRCKLELAQAALGAPELAALQARIAADADDWDARDQLGVRLLAEGDAEAALEQFLAILQHAPEWNEGQAKKRLLAAFASLDDAALVGRYRRRMASMLF